jgi:hypothetical protein
MTRLTLKTEVFSFFLKFSRVRLLILSPFPVNPKIHRRVRHQAPTLIGCKFLKSIFARKISDLAFGQPCLSSSPAAELVSSLQQRSEIMYRFFNFVNCFCFAQNRIFSNSFQTHRTATRPTQRTSRSNSTTVRRTAKFPSHTVKTASTVPLSLFRLRHRLPCFCSGEANIRSIPRFAQAVFHQNVMFRIGRHSTPPATTI